MIQLRPQQIQEREHTVILQICEHRQEVRKLQTEPEPPSATLMAVFLVVASRVMTSLRIEITVIESLWNTPLPLLETQAIALICNPASARSRVFAEEDGVHERRAEAQRGLLLRDSVKQGHNSANAPAIEFTLV